ncbi:hypothetical protein [Niallia sp. NCCP-28]|nr:hypothetical protein [Niallia sp. NCCP-28]
MQTNNQLRTLIWMGIGSAALSSIFSFIIISYLAILNKKVNKL